MKKKLHLIIQALQQDQLAPALEGIHELVADPLGDLMELQEQVAGMLARAKNLQRVQQTSSQTRAQIRAARWQLWNSIRDFLELLVEESGENLVEIPPTPFPIKVLISGEGFEDLKLGQGWEKHLTNPDSLEALVKEILTFRPEFLLLSPGFALPEADVFDELFCVCHEVIACALLTSSASQSRALDFRRHLPQVISLPDSEKENEFLVHFFNALNIGQEISHAYESALLGLQHTQQSLTGFSLI